MMVVFTQLESDLMELDLVSARKEAPAEETIMYVKVQKLIIDEFASYLKREIDFVDTS